MRIIKGFEKIEKREVLDCRIKSLLELAKYYGVRLNSYDVIFLSNSIGFNYGYITIHNSQFRNVPYATASYSNVEEKFFEAVGQRYVKENIQSNFDGMKKINDLIDNNTPIIAKLDCRFFNKGGAFPEKIKINIHYLSSMLIIGSDEQEIYVVLTNSDDIATYRKFQIDEFNRFRWTHCIPYSPKGVCYYLENFDNVNKGNAELDILVLRGLERMVGRMLKSECEVWEPFENSTCEKMSTGINAMKALKKDLKKYLIMELAGKADLQVKLAILFLRNNLIFGSYSAFRKEFAEGLINLGNKHKNTKLQNMGKKMNVISDLWILFFTNLSKAGRNDCMFKFTLVAYITFKKIIRREKRIYRILHKEVKNLIDKLENNNCN